jgi:hypothetical protein
MQGELDLKVYKEVEINGVGMGVLSDGTPYLTGRGLASLCDVHSSRISEIGADWGSDKSRPGAIGVRRILENRGIAMPEHPYIEIIQDEGVLFHAYPDFVCLAVLEYYAFDAGAGKREQALSNYRLLAGKSLHDFIYAQVGYDPSEQVPEAWKQFHLRVSLTYNSVPAGYFGIFKEIADMIVTLGQNGLHLDSSFVPDISVGLAWGKNWASQGLDARYGPRIKWEHNYPEEFPQAESNPQDAWCYPEVALGEFRRWFREDYIRGGKFAKYINNQIKKKQLPPSFAQVVTKAYKLNALPASGKGEE